MHKFGFVFPGQGSQKLGMLSEFEKKDKLLSSKMGKAKLEKGSVVTEISECHTKLEAKRKEIRARDPVANFHLSNGAVVERLNWLGDTSDKGIQQSAGLMVNYLYDLSRIDDNHEAYTGAGRVTVSTDIKAHL